MLKGASAMIFISNKYTKVYFNIISAARARQLPADTYTEKHHIIPKSLGGSNTKDNLVILTAKEHFICHLLLIKMVEDRKSKSKMALAAFMMATTKSTNQSRHRISSRQYAFLRAQSINARKGKPNLYKGKKITDSERLLNLRNAVTLREQKYKDGDLIRSASYIRTIEHIDELKKQLKSRPTFTTLNTTHSKQTCGNISKGRKGQPANNKGISPNKVSCIWCKIEVDIRNFSRYHKTCM